MFARTLTALLVCAAPALAQPTMQLPAEPPACPPCPLPKVEANPLLGTWYREFPGEVVALTVTPDEMKLRVTWAGENAGWATVTAQYTLTKGGLAYGALTGGNGSVGFTDKMSIMMQMLMDAPFSFRFRFTSEGLMIHHLQTCRVLGDSDDVRYAGLYTRAKDDKVPAPVAKPEPRAYGPPVPPQSLVPSSFVPPPGAPVQAPMPMPPAPPSFAPPVRPAALETAPVVQPPVLDGPPPMPPKRPNASAPPDAFKVLADEAFGSLLQQSGVLPKPKPEPELESKPLAPPRYLENFPQYLGPDPMFPLPRELATTECVGAKNRMHRGTWHRELGPMSCFVTIDADHVTVTGTATDEENGKPVRYELVITGDYHLSRDGTTLVGLVTGLDVTVTGANRREWNQFEEVTNLQKAFVGQPFAITVRAYGDVLVIGDVRVAGAGDAKLGGEAAMVAGRYKRAEPKALPRATGATAPRIPMADAEDYARVKELLYQSDTSGPPRCFWNQEYRSDPDVRTKQLRDQSEDLRQIQNEWWRFWFNDQPNHLTPERVHGGIY